MQTKLSIKAFTLFEIQDIKDLTSNCVGQLFWQGASAHFKHLNKLTKHKILIGLQSQQVVVYFCGKLSQKWSTFTKKS